MVEQSEDYESQTQAKQDHLVTNVLNKGFNPGEFAIYLGKQRENGDNVDMWNLDELKEAVF
jgi:hypothetical protein